jgi:hypothetical protein
MRAERYIKKTSNCFGIFSYEIVLKIKAITTYLRKRFLLIIAQI